MTFFGMLPHLLQSECHNLFFLPLKHFKHLPTLFTKTGSLDAPRVDARGRRTPAFHSACHFMDTHIYTQPYAYIRATIHAAIGTHTRSHSFTYTQPYAYAATLVPTHRYTQS